MKKKQFLALFLISILAWTVGNGLFPILPVYAADLGAQPGQTGNFLAISYVGLTAGTLVGGWLADKLQRRKLLLYILCALCAPMFWLMGQSTNIWSLTASTAGYFFFVGAAGPLITILTALFAEPAQRGKIFGLLALTAPMGTIIGGAIVGPSIERWGYPVFFSALAVIFGSLSLLITAFIEDKAIEKTPMKTGAVPSQRAVLGKCFFIFFAASILINIVSFVGSLGTSLSMNSLDFAVSTISMTFAVGGAVVLPILPAIGWLSDRLGRRWLLVFCFIAGFLGLFALSVSAARWHFWVVSILVSIMSLGTRAIGPALVTDIVPRRALGRGLSLLNATPWIGGIIGMGGTGYAVQSFGMLPTFMVAALLPLVALLLLIPIRPAETRAAVPAGK